MSRRTIQFPEFGHFGTPEIRKEEKMENGEECKTLILEVLAEDPKPVLFSDQLVKAQ